MAPTLLTLPQEIRDQVYIYILCRHETFRDWTLGHPGDGFYFIHRYDRNFIDILLSLPSTGHQIHREAKDVFWHHVTFSPHCEIRSFDDDGREPPGPPKAVIDVLVSRVRKLSLTFPPLWEWSPPLNLVNSYLSRVHDCRMSESLQSTVLELGVT